MCDVIMQLGYSFTVHSLDFTYFNFGIAVC